LISGRKNASIAAASRWSRGGSLLQAAHHPNTSASASVFRTGTRNGTRNGTGNMRMPHRRMAHLRMAQWRMEAPLMSISRTNRHIGRPSVSHLDKKRGTVMAGLASGRSLHNCAQAKFPPISLKGVLFGRRPDRGMSPRVRSTPRPVHRVCHVMWWLTAGVRPTTTQQRTGEVPAYFPEGSFIWQATRQRGRLCILCAVERIA